MTADLFAAAAESNANIEEIPFPPFATTVDRLDRPCLCGATAVAMVFQWRPDGKSVFEPLCRDHKPAVTA